MCEVLYQHYESSAINEALQSVLLAYKKIVMIWFRHHSLKLSSKKRVYTKNTVSEAKMSLQIEVNIVYFPELRPPPRGKDFVPCTKEFKRKFYQQEAEIHLVNIAPVTKEILGTQLFEIDLGGVSFTWNQQTNEYIWAAGPNGDTRKPLSLKYINHLLGELRKVGYQVSNRWYTPDEETSYEFGMIKKQFWHLEKKF